MIHEEMMVTVFNISISFFEIASVVPLGGKYQILLFISKPIVVVFVNNGYKSFMEGIHLTSSMRHPVSFEIKG